MDFGFELHRDQLIDHDLSRLTCEELMERVPSIAVCISCGSCTGSCVAAEKTGIGFRKLLIYLRNGSWEPLVSALKYCQLCGKCMLVCPRGVNTRKTIMEMKSFFKVIKT